MLNKKKKERIIEKFKTHAGDTGSPEVQAALLSAEIEDLQEHLHEHKKDFAALFAAVEWEKHYSFSWKEIYNVFQDMPVTKEYDIRFTSFDSQKIIHLLCDTRGFSRERVTSTLEKLEQVHTSKKQKGLGDF